MHKLKTQTKRIKNGIVAISTTLMSLQLSSNLVYAQSGDWAKEAVDLSSSAELGMTQIVAGLLGLGIMGVGTKIALTGEPNFKQLGASVFGGAIVIFGPALARTLFGVNV